MIELIINLAVPLGVIFVAMIVGMYLEKSHFQQIALREAEFSRMPAVNTKDYPSDRPIVETRMVTGSVVVSIDHFKRLLASLRNIFGGEVSSYCTLLDRGRREAILRMKEEFPDADIIVNLRIETSSVSKGQKKQIGSTEVLAYGTAIKYATDSDS